MSVTIYNNHTYQICTKSVYLQFSYQQANATKYVSSSTPCIATGQSYQFNIPFSLTSNMEVGQRGYYIHWVDNGYLLGDQLVVSGSFYVHDAYEKVYLNTQPNVQGGIIQAQNDDFQSPTAQADLSSAVNYYNQADTLVNQGQWQAAVTDLNQAQTLVTQAAAAEQTYWQNQYASLALTIQSGIMQGQNSNYQSTTAQSDLSTAVSYNNQGQSYANQGQYRAAVSSLNQAQSQLSQANSDEQAYSAAQTTVATQGLSSITAPTTSIPGSNGSGDSSNTPSNDWMIYLVIIVMIGVLVAIYLNGHKTKQTPSNESKTEPLVSEDKEETINDHLKILKTRYAKGEITKKQYNKMRKELSES